jgi:hypothetical protein
VAVKHLLDKVEERLKWRYFISHEVAWIGKELIKCT